MPELTSDPLIDPFNHAHSNSDVDLDVDSLHHTLGPGGEQAAAGNHLHIRSQFIAADESTTDGIPTDLATVGPIITIPVAKNGKIIVWASVEVSFPAFGSYPNSNLNSLTLNVTGKNLGTYFSSFSTYFQTGLDWSTISGMWILEDLIPGNTVIKLQYGNASGGALTHYRNRRLAGSVCL